MTMSYGSGNADRSSTTLLHTLVGLLLLAVVALSPIPLGSVSALYWAASAGAIGFIAILYAFVLMIGRKQLRGMTKLMSLQVALFAALLAYLAVQAAPLGIWLGSIGIPGLWGTIESNAISAAPEATLLMLLRQAGYGLFFYLMLQVARNPDRRMRLLNALVVVATVYALVALLSLQAGDVILGFPKWAYLEAATGTFVNRNSLATFLALGACISFSLFLGTVVSAARNGSKRLNWGRLLLYMLSFVVLMLTIVATQSRMGLFSALCGCLFAAVALLLARRDFRILLGGLFLTFGAIVLGFVMFGNGVTERLLTTDNAAVARFDLYKQVLDLITLRPLLGYGGGTFEVVFPLVHDFPVASDLIWDRAHNTYLALWAELGVVAGSIPLVIFALLVVSLVKSLLSGRSMATWLPSGVALAGLVTAGLHSLVDFSLEIQGVTYFFLAIAACGASTAFDRT